MLVTRSKLPAPLAGKLKCLHSVKVQTLVKEIECLKAVRAKAPWNVPNHFVDYASVDACNWLGLCDFMLGVCL